jgi:phage terminase Nu1 subunit (DNA packaging protein)
MSVPLTQEQAADLAGISVRHLRRLEKESNPPPREAAGGYSPRDYGDWLRSRALASVSIGEDGTGYSYEAERARLTHEQADKTALENAEMRADMVRMTIVEQHSIPSRLGGLLPDAALRVKFTVEAETLIYDALAEIQKDAVPPALRQRAQRAARDGSAGKPRKRKAGQPPPAA